MKTICYVPTKGIDDVIASKIGPTVNPFIIASLRGLYDENHSSNLDISDLDKAAYELANYRGQLKKENRNSMNSIGTNVAPSYTTLKKTFTSEERLNRTNMIAAMFSAIIDGVQKSNPELSRRAIIEGYTDSNGRKVLGEFFIFEKVYDQILNLESYWRAKGDNEKADKFRQVIQNWSALSTFTRIKLRDTEEVKLGNKLEFADEATELNYGDNDMTILFNAEEAPRDHWTTTNGMESSFGKVGKQVRRALSSFPVKEVISVVEDGKTVEKIVSKRDDLGFEQMLDPVKTHQILSDLFRGITTEAQMIGALRNPRTGRAKQPWMIPILDALMSNAQLRTAFKVDFTNNFCPYSILTEDKTSTKDGFKRWFTKLLNRTEDLLGDRFMSRILLNKPLNPSTSVYDFKGNVNRDNLNKVINDVKEWLYPLETSTGVFSNTKQYRSKSKFYTKGGTSLGRRAFLARTLDAIGIEIDMDTLDMIMNKSSDLGKLTDALKDLVQYGISEDQLKRLDRGETISYKSMVNRKKQNSRKEGPFKEKVRKINEIITKNREGIRLESRVRHKDSKGNNISLSSLVNPSFMGDRFDKIKAYVEANDKNGLRTYITNEYLGSSFFKRDGVILNKWLEDLLECCNSEEPLSETFANEFYYQRFLGTSDISFENFTSKQHMIDMLTEYRADREINPSSKTALYPVFILGDSGVSKSIRAKRYDEDTIINGLYNVYRQELERQKLVKAVNQKLEEDGIKKTGQAYKKIDNFSNSSNTFTTLQFLNKEYKEGKYANMLSDTPTEPEVKAAIKSYLRDAIAEFKVRLNNLGLLETKEVTEIKDNRPVKITRFVYLGKDVSSENLDSTIADFFMNVKFATIQQLQLMTIDPGFYNGTKDLQKRYKEIHAPGKILSTAARDKYGNKYSEDGIERCVYFDDITLNSEYTNPDFMKSILLKYAVADLTEVEKAIANDILVPSDDESKEKNRINQLKKLLGKNFNLYNKYRKNTLTDGQGYRTLRSYRKVMGMSSQWTEEMQSAYEAIEQIRAEYGYDKDGNHAKIPAEKIAEIERLAVVFQPIKPYLFTHEKLAVNDNNQAIIPVQHKYAEAVLIPELLPAGSKLKDMAYWMDENNIDLAGSTKIVKVGCFGSTDISQSSDAKSLREALSKAYVHQLDYTHYRIQTNVPEHINSSQLFGTQVRKLIMANISKDDYHYQSYINNTDGKVNLGGTHGKVPLNGRNLVAFYNSLIVANILDSFEKFDNSISDVNKLSEALIQNIISNSRESVDNIIAYAIEDGYFSMPLFEGGLEHDASALILSMFKRLVNKQSIKGGSAVQVSSMGINGYKEDGDLKFVTDGKGNILYAECEMPFDLSYETEDGKVVNLEFDDYCNNDGTLKVGSDGKTSLLEERFPGITSILAYRIPTERDYSMLNLRIKRFSRKTAGGTIKVPPEGTTIAGFDFDIDKLYFMMREYSQVPIERRYSQQDRNDIFANIYSKRPEIERSLSNIRARSTNTEAPLHSFWNDMLGENPSFASDPNYNKSKLFKESAEELGIKPKQITDEFTFEEYDFDESPLNNSRSARNNMLINLIQQRLMDPETMEQRTTPGGFANASRSARIMRELLYGDISNIVVNGNIDFESLYDRANDESTDPEPNYDPSDPMTIITYNQQNQVAGKLIGIFANQNTNHAFASLMDEFKIKKPIEFAGHSYDDFLHAPEGVNVDLNVAEFLAASVDAVKDPVLNFMNLNTITADAGAVLARIGYTSTEIGVLFNQPIIREICDYAFNNNVGIDTAIRDIRSKYADEGNDIKSKKEALNSANFTMDKLIKNIIKDRELKESGNNAMNSKVFAEAQLEILSLFDDIKNVANDVSQFVTSTKFTASNAVGSTFGDMYAQQMKVRKYLSTINTEASYVDMKVTSSILSPISNKSELTSLSKEDYLDIMVDNPFAYEQAMFDANRKALIAMSKYFPYDENLYVSARNTLANLTKSSTLDAETINSIHSDVMVYLLASMENSEFNGNLPKNDTGHGEITIRDYYTKWFAKDLLNFLDDNPFMKEKAIFKYMIPTVNEETEDISINIQGIGGLAPYMKEEIKESWAELSRDPELSRIATDLFMYNFYKLGFNFSPLSFMNLAPVEVKQKLQVPKSDGSSRTYVEFMSEIMKGSFNINSDSFAKQYMLNHLDNKRFGIEVKTKQLLDKFKRATEYVEANLIKKEISLDLTKFSKDDQKRFILRDNKKDKTRVFTPLIKVKTPQGEVIYMARDFNETTSLTMTYDRVKALGSKGQSLQYHGDSSETSSTKISAETHFSSEGSTSSEYDPEVPVSGFDRESAVKAVAKVALKIMIEEGKNGPEGNLFSEADLIDSYNREASDTELKEMIDTIKESVRTNGLLAMDQNGKIIKVC